MSTWDLGLLSLTLYVILLGKYTMKNAFVKMSESKEVYVIGFLLLLLLKERAKLACLYPRKEMQNFTRKKHAENKRINTEIKMFF